MAKKDTENLETEEPGKLVDEFKQRLTRAFEQERKRLTEAAKKQSVDIILDAR